MCGPSFARTAVVFQEEQPSIEGMVLRIFEERAVL